MNRFTFNRTRGQEERSTADNLPPAGPAKEFRHEIGHHRLSRYLRKAAFRIVKESLANACRHSKSQRLFAELSVDADMLRIRIRDWEGDFDSADSAAGHSEQNTIRHQIKLLSGTATIENNRGKGTCVTADLPLSQKSDTVGIG